MLIRTKSFPYPVIADGNTSYSNSKFTSDVTIEKNGYNLNFILQYSLNNEELNELIKSQKAVIVHHIECVQTCYRYAVITDDENTIYTIHQSKLNGTVQISTVIVANENLTGYKNSDFSSDYKGFSFDIKKGCLLAIGNCIEIELDKQKDDLENTSSIFSIVPNLDPTDTIIHIDSNSAKDKIAIMIPERSCNIYKSLSTNLELQSAMHSMIIIPALIQVFEELKNARFELYNYNNCRWFKALKKACNKLNIDLDEKSLESLNSYNSAQLLMDSPTIKALNYLAGGTENEN